ncbi:MAG: hypothetical protein IAF38_14365, partial [Bacteroidia bacterium]|nr:hypothetical protein [Bacteroidia bacterium]
SLYYEFKADSVTDVTITYSLTENKLEEIEMRISSKTKDAGAVVLADLKKYFETKYPGPVTQKGVIVYSGKTSDGISLKISLDDQSGVDDGLVSLLVYREQ